MTVSFTYYQQESKTREVRRRWERVGLSWKGLKNLGAGSLFSKFDHKACRTSVLVRAPVTMRIWVVTSPARKPTLFIILNSSEILNVLWAKAWTLSAQICNCLKYEIRTIFLFIYFCGVTVHDCLQSHIYSLIAILFSHSFTNQFAKPWERFKYICPFNLLFSVILVKSFALMRLRYYLSLKW
jgi:hypothetical protein